MCVNLKKDPNTCANYYVLHSNSLIVNISSFMNAFIDLMNVIPLIHEYVCMYVCVPKTLVKTADLLWTPSHSAHFVW